MIDLRHGDLRLTLDPPTGGAIAAFTYRGAALLRPVADPRLRAQHGRAVAAYPLLPYANRIADGRFSFGGQSFQLARNFGDETGSIHGNGWMRAWRVEEQGVDHARLSLSHTPPAHPVEEWPFAYRAEQAFTLAGDRLCITISLQNRDTRRFPAGLGLHPYVARSRETTLRFAADTVWLNGADGLPSERLPVQDEAEFACGRLLGSATIDSCYAGWGGTAVIAMPEDGLTMELDAPPPLDHLQFYTPAGADYFGLEPVANMPDAINRMEIDADHGMQILHPGETMRATIEIGVRSTDG